VLTQVDDQRGVAAAALVAVAVDGLDALKGRLVQRPYLGRRRLGRVAPGIGGVSQTRHCDGSLHDRMAVEGWGENLGRSEKRLGRLHQGEAIQDQLRPLSRPFWCFDVSRSATLGPPFSASIQQRGLIHVRMVF